MALASTTKARALELRVEQAKYVVVTLQGRLNDVLWAVSYMQDDSSVSCDLQGVNVSMGTSNKIFALPR